MKKKTNKKIKPKTKTGYKVGKGKPPKETQFKPGKEWKGDKKGHAKGVPNRSTIAKQVLAMQANPPDEILRTLKMMYPDFFKKKSKKWATEFLMNIRMAQKAWQKGDVKAYQAIMDSAYGKPQGSLDMNVESEDIKEMAEALKKIAKK